MIESSILEYQTIYSAMRFLTSIPEDKTITETSTSTSIPTTSTSTTSTTTVKSNVKSSTKPGPTIESKSASTVSTTTSTVARSTSIFQDPEWFKTPLAEKKGKEGWTGAWPAPLELPLDQRRDTACPYTFRNETRNRIKRWPDIIGIAAPKCGTGTMAFFDCHKKIVFREAEGMVWAKVRVFTP